VSADEHPSEVESEIVARPAFVRADRNKNARRLYGAALAVAPDGKAIRIKFANGRDREGMVSAIQRLARLAGYRANTESCSNFAALIWIDMDPISRPARRQ
jgi:hypothetical protein